jgi:iron complex transport system permease protein
VQGTKTYRTSFALLVFGLICCLGLNSSLGSVAIPLKDTLSSLLGGEVEQESWRFIVWNYRLPKAITAILAGAGLSLSGLLMQTLFRNPLAGPFVLGISSGASLGAALIIMGGTLLSGWMGALLITDVSVTVAASAGSLLVLTAVMSIAGRVKDSMALLIIGLMFGSVTAAVVTVLSYFTDAEQLRQYIFWSYGSLGNLSSSSLVFMASMILIGLVLSIVSIKPLNGLLLGEHYARSMGIPMKRARLLIITATGVLAGTVTAFAGPIAFVGLAVPHLTRQIFDTTDHRILVPAVILYGALLMLLCDTLAQLPSSAYVLPINAITSIIGAPVVIWLLLRKRKMVF